MKKDSPTDVRFLDYFAHIAPLRLSPNFEWYVGQKTVRKKKNSKSGKLLKAQAGVYNHHYVWGGGVTNMLIKYFLCLFIYLPAAELFTLTEILTKCTRTFAYQCTYREAV